LVYFFDGDRFVRCSKEAKQTFVPFSNIQSVRDEFGNEFKGKALEKRLLVYMKAYYEEFPSYINLSIAVKGATYNNLTRASHYHLKVAIVII